MSEEKEEKKTRKSNPADQDNLRRNGKYYIGNKQYVSVTTILQAIAKPALITWGAKMAAIYAIENPEADVQECVGSIYKKRDTAGELGRMIHSLAEALTKGIKIDESNLTEENKPYAEALKSYFDKIKPQVLHAECVIVNETEGYAGTTDLIAEMQDGKIWLADYKTGGIYPEVALQLSAYKHAEYIWDKKNHIKLEMPTIERIGAIQLKNDGTYTEMEMTDSFDVFLATKKLWHWLNK